MKTSSNHPLSISIREDALVILKALQAAGGTCPLSEFRNQILDAPRQATLSRFPHPLFTRLLKCLQHKQLILEQEGISKSIQISSRGEAFLLMPTSLRVNVNDLFSNPVDRWLMRELRQIRMALSSAEERPPYFIFKDYTLLRIVAHKPLSVSDLGELPGFGAYKVNQYGLAILQAVRRAAEQAEAQFEHGLRQKSNWPSFQAVKALFEAGDNLLEIARKRKIQAQSAQRMLEQLHYAGEINLIPWIEQTADPRELQRGVAYFRAVENPRLKVAYEKLNLSYETLRLCRLYVADISSTQEELKSAS